MKLRNKVVAAVSATAMMAGMVMSSVPAFAGSEEMDFINSYNGEVRQWAQYVIDEGCTLEEAQELVDNFIEGEKVFKEESNSNSGISTYADGSGEEYDEELGYYYDRENYAPSKHYVAVINTAPNVTKRMVNLSFSSIDSDITAPTKGLYRTPFSYASSSITINDNITYSTLDVWNYNISIPVLNAIEETDGCVLLMFPVTKGSRVHSEYSLYSNIDFDFTYKSVDDELIYETFAMGDLNHNGKVTLADTYLLEKYLIRVEPDLVYKDTASAYSRAIKLISSDVDQNDKINLNDVIYLNKFISGNYEI